MAGKERDNALNNKSVKKVYLNGPSLARLDEYAEANNLTRSSALAEVVTAIAEGTPVPAERKKVGKVVTFWIQDARTYLAFTRIAKKNGLTYGQAIAAGLEELT